MLWGADDRLSYLYVDNLGTMSLCSRGTQLLLDRGVQLLNNAGLVTHEEVGAACDGDALGVRINGVERLVEITQ